MYEKLSELYFISLIVKQIRCKKKKKKNSTADKTWHTNSYDITSCLGDLSALCWSESHLFLF